MDQFIDVIRFPGKPGFRKQNRVIGMSSPENRVFQTNPTFFQGLVGQGIYIYAHQNISSTLPMDCHVAEPQESGPFLLNQSLKWSWHHPAGRFHTLTWGTAIDHQMQLR